MSSSQLSLTELPLTTKQNILVRREDPPIIKVADFGDAKMEDDTTLMRVSFSDHCPRSMHMLNIL